MIGFGLIETDNLTGTRITLLLFQTHLAYKSGDIILWINTLLFSV